MASKFHPIYSGVWKDPRLEGAPFERKAFFAWLFSNDAVRPSGIYRVTDAQAAAETELSIARVRAHFADLAQRGRIIRDGAWVFVQGYLKRQPNGAALLNGARSDVDSCTSVSVLRAFGAKYPLYSRWSVDRLATIERPINENWSTEQCSAVAVQSNTEQCKGGCGGESASRDGSAHPPASPGKPLFAMWPEIEHALNRCRLLGTAQPLRDARWWLAELEANDTVDLIAELLKAEAWLVSNPKRGKSDYRRFLHNWLARADREE